MSHPGAQQSTPNKSKSKNNFTPLLVTILVLLVAFCAGVALYFNFIKPTKTQAPAVLNATKVDPAGLNKDEKSAYDTTNSFLKSVKEGNYSAAYNLFSDDLKKEYTGGLNDFTTAAQKANLQTIKDWAISKVETNGNKDRITVKGSAIFNTPNPTGRIEFGYYKAPSGEYKMYLWQIYPEL